MDKRQEKYRGKIAQKLGRILVFLRQRSSSIRDANRDSRSSMGFAQSAQLLQLASSQRENAERLITMIRRMIRSIDWPCVGKIKSLERAQGGEGTFLD